MYSNTECSKRVPLVSQKTPEITTMADVPQKVPQFYRRVLPDTCISFYSEEGKKIFREALDSGHMECYFKLAAQFRTQDEPAFCGLTTLVIALNALEVDPGAVWKGEQISSKFLYKTVSNSLFKIYSPKHPLSSSKLLCFLFCIVYQWV